MSKRAGGWLRPALILTAIVALCVGVGAFVAGRPGGSPAAAPAASGRPSVGSLAPDFTGTDLTGATVSLADYRGKPLWLSFGATWCIDCRTEFPDMEAARAASGVAVVSVFVSEDAAVVKPYVEKLGLTTTNVPDPQGVIQAAYAASAVPTHYFIGADGRVKLVRAGALSRSQMDADLATLLASK